MTFNQLKAHTSEGIMYGLYLKWRNSSWAVQRHNALVAKTYGIVYWDRAMFPRDKT